MDGILFYWMSWIVWVIVMFFIPKTVPFRFDFLFHLLAVMVLAGYKLEVSLLSVQLSGLYLLFILCVYIRKLSIIKLMELICGSLIITLAYASFQLFSLLDPIWLIMKPSYLMCIFLNYLILLLFKNWKHRLFVLLIGLIMGDIIYSGLLVYHSLPYAALTYAWHDDAVLILGSNILWRILELVGQYIYLSSQSRVISKQRKENFNQ
ncbi:YphA family membrane protein [Peribacillus sp. NPDC097895]|uniref:YphA family membrane protein n=1 Tax=Peribacillus sp. NPDC097895 TaxID=3390619 RepID=UPI003D043BEC